MSERLIQVLEGSTFVVGDDHGDVDASAVREHGFYSDDTRFISRWALRVRTDDLRLLGVDQTSHFAARFFLTARVGPHDAAPYSVIRSRLLDAVWTESLGLINHQRVDAAFRIELDVTADFADLFEVKDGEIADRVVERRSEHAGLLRFDYVSGDFRRSAVIRSEPAASVTSTGLAYDLVLAPGEEWSATFVCTPESSQPGGAFKRRTAGSGGLAAQRRGKQVELDAWLHTAPLIEASNPDLAATYRSSLTDLAALRVHPDLDGEQTFPAAGLPWFMALFGRDSILASYQALPYLPDLARTTLEVLASRQATERDDVHEREPGKILHELRYGELTATGQRPHSPYFGSADATPLFLVLLDEYHRWTGDADLVRRLEPNARAALAWIEESGDADSDGYVEYARRNHVAGLHNQCWKDSWDSIQFADGTLARGPLALAEIQGYVYDALRRSARLAQEVWSDPALGTALEARAEALRLRFRADFWMKRRDCHALALDGSKRQVDALTSNIGHLLWSGILDDHDAAATAAKLTDDELFSGWGVRTVGSGERGYNPLGYHTGTVWPHDTALIVAGLARYGFDAEATMIGAAVMEAAPHFEHRLPEVFGGYPRSLTGVPVAFPTASRPQAWAAGAPLLILTALSHLQPGGDHHSADLGPELGTLELTWRPTR